MHAKHANRDRVNDLSGRVIGRAFTVLNTLGAGFLEQVHQNALAFELCAAGLSVAQQFGAKVYYHDPAARGAASDRVEDSQSTGRRASDAMHQ